VNTVDEFRSYYYQSDKHTRGHRGFIVYTSHTSKLNFLDLGGILIYCSLLMQRSKLLDCLCNFGSLLLVKMCT
jgi:hypothetical protein